MSPRNGGPDGDGEGRRGRSSRAQGQRAGGSRDDDYRRRRDRNNLAVKRSRVRSKLRTQETLERVHTLKAENEALEDRIKTLGKELGFLKELFINHGGSGAPIDTSKLDLEALLKDNADDDLLRPNDTENEALGSREDFKAESPGDGDTEDSETYGPS